MLVALPALLLAGCAAPPDRGPMPVRNQHPAQLLVQHLDPIRAATLPPGTADLRWANSYSSLFLSGAENGDQFAMDGEIWRSSIKWRQGVADGFELSAELPVLHTTGGFLDGFIVGYHDALGLPDQSRSDFPRNRFRVFARHDGQEVYALREESLLLADVPLSAAFQLCRPYAGSPGVLLRAGVELPTGDEDRGAGNGELDATLGVAASLPLRQFTVHGHAQHTFAGTPARARAAGLSFRDVTALGLGLEFGVTDRLGALVQVEWETSTLRGLDLARTQREQVLLWLGGRWQIGDRWHLEFALGEDLQGFASPDFTLWLSLGFRTP